MANEFGSGDSGGTDDVGAGSGNAVARGLDVPAMEPVAIDPADEELREVWNRHNAERTRSSQDGGREGGEGRERNSEGRGAGHGYVPSSRGNRRKVSGQPADRGFGQAGPGEDGVNAGRRSSSRLASEPPRSWSDEMKAKWAAVPPDVRSYIAQRETEAHQAITRAGQERGAFEPVRAVIEQHRDVFERAEMAPEQGIGAMLAIERMLQQNPVAAIEEIAKAYGVDLSGAKAAQTPAAAELAALRQQVARLSSQQSARRDGELLATVDGLNRTIADFSSDKAHWEEVEETIIGLIPGIRANHPGLAPREILAKAYEEATWANPRTRSKARLAEERKRAADAKRVSGINVRSGPAARRPKSQEDILEEIALKAYGRRR